MTKSRKNRKKHPKIFLFCWFLEIVLIEQAFTCQYLCMGKYNMKQFLIGWFLRKILNFIVISIIFIDTQKGTK